MSKRMSEYNKNIFRAVNGKLSGYRCAHVLYIVHRNEYFVRKVSWLLYRIYLFCIWCCGWHKQGDSERVWIMQELVHDIYCRYIDENLSGHEVDEWRVRCDLKYKKVKNEKTAKYNAERRAIFAVDETFLQNDLQKYERALHY